MACNLDKILWITQLCLLFFSRGEMKLKFNQSLPKDTEKRLVDDALKNLIKLECRTNKLASFIWQDCYYHSDDIYDPLIYASCEELYSANTCRNIPKKNNWIIYPSPTELKSSLKSSLRHYVTVPKTGGCIGCFASSGNETIRSFTKYYFKDCCGAPDKKDATFPDSDCGTREIPCGLSKEEFQRRCKIGEPEEMSVIEELSEEGKLDLILRWKNPTRNGHYKPFGFEIEVDEDYDHSCRRLTTMYSNFTVSVSAPGYQEYRLLGKPSLKIYFNHKYEIKIRTLPFSEWVKIDITTRSGRELCDEYYKKTGKRPSRCYNLTISNCTADKSVTVSWTINQTFPDDVNNVTYLEDYQKSGIWWEFDKTNTSITFENVTKPFTLWMFMRSKDREMLNIQEIRQISCEEPTPTPTKRLSTTMRKPVLDTAVIYAVVIGSILFSLILLSIIIYFGLRKVRTDLVGFNRLLSREGNDVTMEIGSTSDDKRALIVYPQGCYEVEQLVLFLVKQLNCIGIYPLTDLTQGQRVGEEGETVVMINDFEKATYIIILCTDGIYEFENHKMYNFIMKDLVTADCVHKNSSRYAALYFKKSHRVVPPHLLGRSYAMPNDFRRLLMYFLGVGTFARIYEMLLDTVIGQIDSRYSELKGLVEQLNHSFHNQCDISQCRKGRADMLTEPSVLIKNGKKSREDTPSHDSGIHQMGSMIFGSQESMNSKPSGSIDEDEEGIDSERDKLFKEEEL